METIIPKREAIMALLRENGQTISDNVDFSFVRIGEGNGFASMLYKVHVGTATYAVKITNPRATLDGFEDTNLSVHENIHNREVDFYRWVSQLPEVDQTQFNIPRFFGGSHCKGDEVGIVILEDMSDRMIGEVDVLSGFSVDLMKEIIESIASYQSVHHHSENKFPVSDKKGVYHSLGVICRQCIDSLSDKSWFTENTKKKMMKYSENVENLTEEYPEFARNAPRMLIHCDLWPMNLLYKKVGEDVRLLSIIDWQCVSIGNALFDVAVILAIALTPDVRRTTEQELVEYYWREMQQKCAQLGTSFNIDLETAHRLYRHCLKWASLMLAMMLQFQKAADAPDTNANEGPISGRLRALLEDLDD